MRRNNKRSTTRRRPGRTRRTGSGTGSSNRQVRQISPAPQAIIPLTDPRFQVFTCDASRWVHPFDGRVILIQGTAEETIRQVLGAEQRTWQNSEPLPLERLRKLQWKVDLPQVMTQDPRFRIFVPMSGGRRCWLNPFTAEPVEQLERPGDGITAPFLHALARYLSDSLVDPTREKPLPMATLRAAVHGLRAQQGVEMHDETKVVVASEVQRRADVLADRTLSKVQEQLIGGLPEIPGFTLAARYLPCDGLGGDFYLAETMKDGRQLILMGDVCGHGADSALLAVTALKAARMLLPMHETLVDFLTALNESLRSDMRTGQFITIAALALDAGTAIIESVLCGHHPLLILNPNSSFRTCGQKGMAVGLGSSSIFSRTLKSESFQLEPWERLLVYTDGLLEAKNEKDEEFEEEGLQRSMLSAVDKHGHAFLDAILGDVSNFATDLDDDVTMLVIEADGEDEDYPFPEHDEVETADKDDTRSVFRVNW